MVGRAVAMMVWSRTARSIARIKPVKISQIGRSGPVVPAMGADAASVVNGAPSRSGDRGPGRAGHLEEDRLGVANGGCERTAPRSHASQCVVDRVSECDVGAVSYTHL